MGLGVQFIRSPIFLGLSAHSFLGFVYLFVGGRFRLAAWGS